MKSYFKSISKYSVCEHDRRRKYQSRLVPTFKRADTVFDVFVIIGYSHRKQKGNKDENCGIVIQRTLKVEGEQGGDHSGQSAAGTQNTEKLIKGALEAYVGQTIEQIV